MTTFRGLGSVWLFCASVGCNAFDAPIPESGERLVVPTDTRTPVVAERKPPAISGGTLIVLRSGGLAVASDPERDSIVIADLGSGTLRGTIALEPGDEPGRLVEDATGRVHVALRRGGAVVTIDPWTNTVVERRAVCGAPRGIALSAPETLEVACADGKLVTLPTTSGGVLRSVSLETDLRDVIVRNGVTTVTRFKASELLRLDASGTVTARNRPTSVMGRRLVPSKTEGGNNFGPREVEQPFRPLVAWRALAGPNGSTVVVHQRAVDASIEIVDQPASGGSSYGGDGFSGCGGISQNAITVIGAEGATTDLTFAGAPLPVDATLLPDGVTLLVAHAGPRDPRAPRPFVVFDGVDEGLTGPNGGGSSAIGTLSIITLPPPPAGPAAPDGTVASDPSCLFASTAPITDPAVAVAFNPARPTQVVVQTRQPSSLVIIDNLNQFSTRTIFFDDGATLDTGFQIFHRDSGGGIACATCHAESAEDGNVWRFDGLGERRTQALNVGLDGTAPFHWDGTLYSVGMLMSEVFVGRMGGIHESAARLSGLEDWIFAQRPPAPLRAADDAAVLRGKDVFHSRDVGCATCHSGSHFTNNESRYVGTDERVLMQVPPLVGIAYRAPFMHDGCAPTLAARFDPACGGGEEHGNTAHLTAAEISDLVAYLESL